MGIVATAHGTSELAAAASAAGAVYITAVDRGAAESSIVTNRSVTAINGSVRLRRKSFGKRLELSYLNGR